MITNNAFFTFIVLAVAIGILNTIFNAETTTINE